MNNENAEKVLDRLRQVYGVDNDTELAKAIGVKRSTFGGWRSRGKVPYAVCVTASLSRKVSLDWLLTGEGGEEREIADSQSELSPQEQAILSLFRALDEAGQREILGAAQEKERMRRLEQRLEELVATVADIKKPA